MIKKTILMLLAVFSLFPKIKAQEVDPYSNSILWKISGKDLKKPSYIVLTTANLCEEVPSLMTKMSKILDNISFYYTETGINNPKYSEEAQKYAHLKSGEESVRKLLPAKTYLKIKSKLGNLGIDEKTINQFKPLMICNILSRYITPECNTTNQTEAIFRAYASQYNFQVSELLSVAEAFKILNDYGDQYYLTEIENLVNNEAKIRQDIVAKAGFYQQENLRRIKEIYTGNTFFSSRYNNIAVENARTKLLSDKIAAVIKKGGALITLDISNIMNSKSNLYNELKNQGYTLTPVN